MVVVSRWRRVLWFSKNIFYIQEKVLKEKQNKHNPGRKRQVYDRGRASKESL